MNSFIDLIKDSAIELYNNGGNLLPSVTIAQAILESGWGKSELSKKANNYFGIKGEYNGQSVTMLTNECVNGEWIKVNAKFRKYPSIYDSLKDHDNLMNLDRYTKVRIAKSYKSQCEQLYNCGYATDYDYANKLIQIIEYNKLYNYDNVSRETIKSYLESGRATCLYNMNVRNSPSLSSSPVDIYYKGESFIYDSVYINENYYWVSYISYTGVRRYVVSRSVGSKEIYLECK